MTPSDLRAYLRNHGAASIDDLAAHFGSDPGMVADILAWWARKGRIETVVADCGKSCCQNRQATFWRWKEQRADPPSSA
jgi:hypothetical protein